MTVSRVVNGSGSVKEATRVKILNAIKEMGYRKDVFASINSQKRNGIKKRTHVTINFPIAYFSEKEFLNFFSSINMQIISALQTLKLDYSLIHFNTEKKFDDIDTILSSNVFIHCGKRSQESYKEINKLNPHAKHIGICFYLDNESSVHPDDAEGGKLAAKHFYGHGHKNIMCLAVNNDDSICERSTSFKANMNMLDPDSKVDILTYSCKESEDATVNIIKVLDEYFEKNTPSAIFAPNGYDTMVLYKYLKNKGLNVPMDIGILGYDELEFYDYIDFPLSRIIFSQKGVAEVTVNLVQDILDGRLNTSVKSLIPVSLVDKKSVIDIDYMNSKGKL